MGDRLPLPESYRAVLVCPMGDGPHEATASHKGVEGGSRQVMCPSCQVARCQPKPNGSPFCYGDKDVLRNGLGQWVYIPVGAGGAEGPGTEQVVARCALPPVAVAIQLT